MRKKGRLVASVACGIVCAACVLLYTQGVQGEAKAAREQALARYGGDQIEVVVALHDIAPGRAIGTGDVATKLWVADLLPEGAVTRVDDVSGKSTSSAIFAGEVITNRRFEAEQALLDVPTGMTAVSLPAKEVQAVGGAVGPGMDVDVYATGSSGTTLIGHALKVLATSTSQTDGSGSITWITVAIAPEKAQELVAAAVGMQLYFTLPGNAVA